MPGQRPVLGRVSPRPSIARWNAYNTYNDLAFPQLVAIMRAAERGMTEQWADLTRRMLTSDDHLFSVWETRVNAVAGSKWKLNPGQDGDAELARRAADDCERVLRGVPALKRVLRDILDGVATGWSISEIIWQPRGDEWVPAEIVWLHPRRFRFGDNFAPYLWDDGLAAGEAGRLGLQTEDARSGLGMPLTPDKYIVHMPRCIQTYPTSSGVLMACVRAWWVKLNATKYWLAGAEVSGNPRYFATAPQAASSDVFDELQSSLEQLAGDGIAAFREGTAVNIQAPLAQGSGSVWQTLYDNCNAAMSKAILGSTLNVEIGAAGGNRAAAESQADMTMTPRAMADADAMWETIARDLFRPYLAFNRHRYGGVVPPLPMGETVMFEPQAQIDDLIVRVGAVTKNELRASRNLEPLAEGGDVLIPAEVAQPAGGFPFSQQAGAEAPAALPLRATPPWVVASQTLTRSTSRS
jgi:phage gp29-like protein